jgi:hypothetical protein
MSTSLDLESPSRGAKGLLTLSEKTGGGSAIAAAYIVEAKPIAPPKSRIDQEISMKSHQLRNSG